jgi:hypothetical protein
MSINWSRSVWALALVIVLAGTSCQPDRAEVEGPVNPAPLTGACCNLATGSCVILTSVQCGQEPYNHQYLGDNTLCSPNLCPVPQVTGACCINGSCQLLASQACTTAGGVWQGANTVCTPDPCAVHPQTGACCSPDGSCLLRTSQACTAAGGVWQGLGTGCSPNPCPVPQTGACCMGDDSCQLLAEQACATAGGLWQGLNTVCTPNPCQHEATFFMASLQVSSSQGAKVASASGAAITVPKWAVPQLNGQDANVVFSIERAQGVSPILPVGVTKMSQIYRFGPEGFNFARQVKVTVPYDGTLTGKELALFRINQTTNKCESYGGIIDTLTKTITAMTYKLSPWFVGSAPATNTAYGAFKVTNLSSTHWLRLCLAEVTLAYPEADADFTTDAASSWAPGPVGEIGWTNTGNWYLPQGTYRFCVEMGTAGTLGTPPGPPVKTTIGPFVLNHAWNVNDPVTVDIPAFSGPGPDWTDGRCSCVPEPTVPVGTGQVQVTLTWHSATALDLDLWVTDPGGVKCYYGNNPTASGGTLDRDNKCGNYEDGRPENIFWAIAPTGQYKVEVNWWGDCNTGATSMPFEVRVVNGASTRTYPMTINAGQTVEVTRFDVQAVQIRSTEGLIGEGRRVVFGVPSGRVVPGDPHPVPK